MAMESARLDPPKIEFSCACGKRYRVPARKAGKRVTCKGCRRKVRVPGDAQISLRSRQVILAEFGIDPEQAAQAFEQEQQASYACSLCARKLAEDEVGGAYGPEGLVCSTCRAAAVEQRGEPAAGKKKDKAAVEWSSGKDPAAVQRKALTLGALFFAGVTGLVWSVFGLSLLASAGIGAVVALGGAKLVQAQEG